jgi:2-polyprenyl-3-methyl-5-hydroxy-6-metoxy-1,4-benzoquinol methylase
MKFSDERVVPCGSFTDIPDHMARYRFASTYVRDAFVLDAGCGCGYGSYYLAENGARKVIGIDISEEALQFAKSHYIKDNVEFERMDAVKLLFESNSFDVVVSFEVIEHVRDYERYLREIRRVLKPSGVLILSTPNKKFSTLPDCETPTWKWHTKEFYPRELKQILKDYFEQVEVLGLHVINQQFLREQKKLDDRIKETSMFLEFIPVEIIRLVPMEIKHFFLGKNPVTLVIEDIEISDKDVQNARDLVSVCYK